MLLALFDSPMSCNDQKSEDYVLIYECYLNLLNDCFLGGICYVLLGCSLFIGSVLFLRRQNMALRVKMTGFKT